MPKENIEAGHPLIINKSPTVNRWRYARSATQKSFSRQACNPTTRFTQLAEFCDDHSMTDEAAYFRKAIEAIAKKKRKKK